MTFSHAIVALFGSFCGSPPLGFHVKIPHSRRRRALHSRTDRFRGAGGFFLIEGVNRAALGWSADPNEGRPFFYFVRFLSFLLILIAIVKKNLKKAPDPTQSRRSQTALLTHKEFVADNKTADLSMSLALRSFEGDFKSIDAERRVGRQCEK